jgi:hypothetical protein
VCDVLYSDWLGNYNEDPVSLPCCCGPLQKDGRNCTETWDFIIAANLQNYSYYYSTCGKSQYKNFSGPPASSGRKYSTVSLGLCVVVAMGWVFSLL